MKKTGSHTKLLFTILLIAVSLLSFTGEAKALMLKMSMEELTGGADSIVVGTIIDIDSRWNDERTAIYTEVSISVEERIKGSNQDRQVTVIVPGGEAEGITQAVSDMPVFNKGEKVLLFLEELPAGKSPPMDRQGLGVMGNGPVFRVRGQFQGRLDVANDRIGKVPISEFKQQVIHIMEEDGVEGLPLQAEDDPVYVSQSEFRFSGHKWFGNWPDVKYKVNHANAPSGSSTAVQNAATTWSNAGARFSFTYDGTHSRTGYALRNGVNEVIWYSLGSNAVLAQANWWYNSTGEIFEADVIFNSYYSWSNSTPPSRGAIDVQTVALHELGHWLSLGHSDTFEAVMYSQYKGMQRTLHADDITGIKYIYGSLNRNIWLPGAGDWNGNGFYGVDLYDQQDGRFYIKDNNTSGSADRTFRYGPSGNDWLPVAGDWNGNGVYGVALYDQMGGSFYIKDTTTPGPADRTFRYGPRGNDWLPVAGDWNGDGIYGVALYDQMGGSFYIKDTTTPGPADRTFRYGPRGNDWLPVAGDWNGNSIYGVALYDQLGGIFYIKDNTTPGPADRTFRYGPRGNDWLPVAGDWNGNSIYGVALFDQQDARFYIKNGTTPSQADITFRFSP